MVNGIDIPSNGVIHKSISSDILSSTVQLLPTAFNYKLPSYHKRRGTEDHTSAHYVGEEHLRTVQALPLEDTNNGIGSSMHHLQLDGMNCHKDIVRSLRSIFDHHSIILSGRFYYRKGDFLSWHTNIREPGLRLYITHVPEGGKSFFRYQQGTGPIVTTYDKKGWSYRLFQVTEENPLWHCVYSDTDRLSIGFRIFPNL